MLCRRCGVVFHKLEQASAPRPRRVVPAPAAVNGFPYQLATQLLLLLFLSSLGLSIWSHWKKDRLPASAFYDASRLGEPLQTRTEARPFKVEAQGIVYTIEPLFDYELNGVVVTLHDSDVFWDIYHFKDWKDFINIRDLCVVWGGNVGTGAFRAMAYSSTTWTCWVAPTNDPAAQAFAPDQLSNNHLLTRDPAIQQAIKSAEIGDQIRFRGKLARYSHAGGFQRGTSITRTDQGNGACETVFVEEFQITRKSNPGWRLVYRVSLFTTIASLIVLTVVFIAAPVRVRGA